ncbi:MAG TPA: hypothetical protein VF941_13155, partial [Clostridia bacterium]
MKKITGLFLCICILMQSFLCIGFSGTVFAASGGTTPLSFTVTDSAINPTQPIIYFSDMANKKLYEFNYETGNTREITFVYQPEHITYANGKIYVCLLKRQHDYYWFDENQSGAFAVIDAASFTVISQPNILMDPYSVTADVYGNVYISGGSGQWTSINSYSENGTKISSVGQIFEESILCIHPNYNRIYSISTNYNAFINTQDFDGSGNFSNLKDKGTYNLYNPNNASISPDGKYMFANFSTYTKVFSCDQSYASDAALVGTIPGGSKNMAFDLQNNRFFMCDGSNQIGVYDYDFMEKTGTITASNNVNKIYFKNGNIIALTSNSNNQFSIENLSSSNITQIPSENNTDSYSVKFKGSVTNILYDGGKAYSVDSSYNHLFISDLATRQVIKEVKLPYRPYSLCVSEDKTKIYIANYDTDYPVSELDINTGNVLRNLKYSISGDDSSSYPFSVAGRKIYNNGGKLYLVGAGLSPKLYVFDASTFSFISSPVDQVSSITFSPDNKYLYCSNGSALNKYSIDGNEYRMASATNTNMWSASDNNNMPVLLLNDRDVLVYKRYIFKSSDLTNFVNSFPESVYAINTNANIAVGLTGFYDLNTGLKIIDFDFSGASSFFFDQDGTLYYLKNNVLKISKLLNFTSNSSQISLEKNQEFQAVISAVYSDGRSNIVTSDSIFETSNANVAR